MTTFNLYDETIDVRDIIERFEELEDARDNYTAPNKDGYQTMIGADWAGDNTEDAQELDTLQSILNDLKGNGGDEQWRGDWYPITLIRESYFQEYMDDLIADCYPIPELPSFMSITLDYVALQMDYTSTEIDGVIYFYR